MIAYLFNKLPAVRRLRADLAAAQARVDSNHTQLAHERGSLNASLQREAELRDSLAHVKEQRNQARNELGQLREVVVKQAASIEILTKDRERGERSVQELTLRVGESTQREERFMRTIETLNENCRARMAELDDARAELAEASAQLARYRRPVLFARADGMSEEDRARALGGRADSPQVKALLDLLDECATAAMSENATRPGLAINDGKTFIPGFSDREREFTSGGVFALVELKRRALDLIIPQADMRQAA